MSEANKALVRRVYEMINSGGLADAEEVIHVNMIGHNTPQGLPDGVDGFIFFYSMLRAGFPDLQVVVEDQVAEGDKVVSRVSWSGTHLGEFFGLEPTFQRFEMSAIDIFLVEDGRCVEHWGNSDDLSMLRQLGLLPGPEEAPE
jgi:predicted ester cyclase